MTSRLHVPNKITTKATSSLSTAPTQGMFQSRPFVVQCKKDKVQQPDLKTSLMQVENYGYHLHRMQPNNDSNITAVQLKTEESALQVIQAAPNLNDIREPLPPAPLPGITTVMGQPTPPNKKPRPKSWHEMDRTNQSPQFQEGLGIMREALNIDPAHRNDPKIGFPFSHFDHAFGTNEKQESMTVKGGIKHERKIQTPKDTTNVERITPMLPTSLTQGGHLGHQLRQGDAAKASSSSGSQNQVTMDRVREASVGVKFAKDTGLSLDKLHQPSPKIDFQSETPSGKEVQFDPFTSPQSKKPTTKQLLGQKLVKEGTITEDQNPQKQTPINARQQEGIDRGWVKNAFTEHTNQSKGKGVIGLWDQTSDSQQRVNELQKHIPSGNSNRRLQNVDLKLDEEYVKEDMQARRDLAKTRRRQSI